MTIEYGSIMSWIIYLESGFWDLNRVDNVITERMIIDKFNDLFRNEFIREYAGGKGYGYNPYKGIGNITVFLNEDKETYTVIDTYNYLTCFYKGINSDINGKKLCLDLKAKGFYCDYFEYRTNEDKNHIFVINVIEGKCPVNQNVRRLISILFTRLQPYLRSYDLKDAMFSEYSELEKEEMIKNCKEY